MTNKVAGIPNQFNWHNWNLKRVKTHNYNIRKIKIQSKQLLINFYLIET